jgi:hypothetical protein
MPQTCAKCAKEYAATETHCPHCLAANPEVATFAIPTQLRFNSPATATVALASHASSTSTSISLIQDAISNPITKYSMGGSMAATTTVTQPNGTERSFTTSSANMHSEMVALKYMLETGGWVLSLGAVQWAHDGSKIAPSQFKTAEPHCGFCTVMLEVLGLPLGKPTKGNYNLACNFNYPLPPAVKEDPYVLARVLGRSYCAFDRIKSVLNSFVSGESETWVLKIMDGVTVNDHHYATPTQELVHTWQKALEKGQVNQVWEMVFKSIYSCNR